MKHETFAKAAMGRRIHILFRLSMMHIRNEMKKMEFGAGDYPFLAMLFFREGVSQDELSNLMRVDKSYTARAIARLEKIGMVVRRPDPAEHRIKRVYLSENSRRIEPLFFEMLENWQATLVKEIATDHVRIIQDGLDQMIENAEEALGLEKVRLWETSG